MKKMPVKIRKKKRNTEIKEEKKKTLAEKEKKKLKKVSVKVKGVKKNTISKSNFVNIIEQNLETPLADLCICSIVRPSYLPNSGIPRYKISLLFNEENKDHDKYLKDLDKKALNNDVDIFGYRNADGFVIISFVTKDKPLIYISENSSELIEVDLDSDLPRNIKTKIIFDLKKYFDKSHQKNAFSFELKKAIFYLDENSELQEVE